MRVLFWLMFHGTVIAVVVVEGFAPCYSIRAGTKRHNKPSTNLAAPLWSTQKKEKGRSKQQKQQQQQASSPEEEAQLPTFTQVDVIYGSRTSLVYDAKEGRFLPREQIRNELEEIKIDGSRRFILSPILNSPPVTMCRKIVAYHIRPYMAAAFVPEGVTPAYHAYTVWRLLQRLINANLQVFGTQSLLLGLGIKTKSLAAVSAALNWILKDALGKIVRMIWASKMGGRFDSDAKRWRMRASFLYAFGNGMEIATYVVPQLFLLFATVANCCKQMSMLTCSSTRTALYNSFRDGTRENIGDITAKGEASIAVVDLVGIATGVSLSRAIGTSVSAVLSMYMGLQTIELFCIYRMMKTVQFRVLNFERLVQVLQDFIGPTPAAGGSNHEPASKHHQHEHEHEHHHHHHQQQQQEWHHHSPTPMLSSSSQTSQLEVSNATTTNGASHTAVLPQQHQHKQQYGTVETPEEMAKKERIVKPPNHLARRGVAFGSLSRAPLDPVELLQLLDIFSKERFLLVVGKNMKKKRSWRRSFQLRNNPGLKIQENCHIVLHTEATNADIVKSSLALMLLRQKLSSKLTTMKTDDPDQIRTRDCLELVRESCQEADRLLPRLLRQLANRGWTSPARFMFGRVTMRADWPLKGRSPTQHKQQHQTKKKT